MQQQYQIIGGGLIGLATAYALLRRGAKHVRVIEAREAVALETSFANAGMLHASLANPWNGPGVGRQLLRVLYAKNSPLKLQLSALPSLTGWGVKFLRSSRAQPHWHATRANYTLAEYSLNLNQKWRQELSIEDGYEGDGLLKIYRTAHELSTALDIDKKLKAFGLTTKCLTATQTCEKEPALKAISGNIVGALYYPTDFKADAYFFCKALEVEILRLGGEIICHTTVDGFIETKGNMRGVKTQAGQHLADVTIVACGAHSYKLLKPMQVKLALRPVKGYSLSLKIPQGLSRRDYPKIPVVDENLHTAITPFKDFIRIAGAAEIAGFDSGVQVKKLTPLMDMLGAVYPQLAKSVTLKDGKPWHGFRPVSADGMPFIGHTKMGGLMVNTGHGHMGWTLCAGSGALIADIALGKQTAVNADVFHPHRT